MGGKGKKKAAKAASFPKEVGTADVAKAAAALKEIKTFCYEKYDELNRIDSRLQSDCESLMEDYACMAIRNGQLKSRMVDLETGNKKLALEVIHLQSESGNMESEVADLENGNKILKDHLRDLQIDVNELLRRDLLERAGAEEQIMNAHHGCLCESL